MSGAAPNLEALRQQTDVALHELIDAGTSDSTTANIIEAVHSLARRAEIFEAMVLQYIVLLQHQVTANPAANATAILETSTNVPIESPAAPLFEPGSKETPPAE
jgi:hypothetical protein